MLTTILQITSLCVWPAVILTALILFRPRKKH
jgi:hypothetical protein